MKILWLLLLTLNGLAMSQTIKPTDKIKFLALGDSYTIGESVAENERWPVQLVDTLASKGFPVEPPEIIATTGWRTDDLKRAIIAAKPATDFGLVSLLIGVNNQYQGKSVEQYKWEFEELLHMAITFANGDKSKVFVVSIPDYGFTPFGKAKQQDISKAIDEFNSVNRAIAEKTGVRYFNITDISRRGLEDATLIAADGLHPSGKMYAQWTGVILHGLIN
jgi:lysophospholipase L1-like esterase